MVDIIDDILSKISEKKRGKDLKVISSIAVVKRDSKRKGDPFDRRSLLDVINWALQQTERVTYLHRLTYVGKHRFVDTGEGSEELDYMFQNSVNVVNENNCTEPLTGCFIYYSKYFIHVVEGSEDSIGDHVEHIVGEMAKFERKFGVVKIILMSHHIRRRYFGAWFSMYGVPRTLIEKITGDDESETARQIENFHKKILNIASYLEKQNQDTEQTDGEVITQKALALLPEVNLLDFLLTIDVLSNLKDYLETYKHFPHLHIYSDHCWPPIMEFVPYSLYYEPPPIKPLEVPAYHPAEEIEVERRAEDAKAAEEAKLVEREKRKSSSIMDFLKASKSTTEPE